MIKLMLFRTLIHSSGCPFRLILDLYLLHILCIISILLQFSLFRGSSILNWEIYVEKQINILNFVKGKRAKVYLELFKMRVLSYVIWLRNVLAITFLSEKYLPTSKIAQLLSNSCSKIKKKSNFVHELFKYM